MNCLHKYISEKCDIQLESAITGHRVENDYSLSNWSLFERTWQAFLDYLADRWWGSVSAETLCSVSRRLNEGSCIVVAPFPSPTERRYGELCTIIELRRGGGVRLISVCAVEGNYTLGCYTESINQGGFKDLISVIESLLLEGVLSLARRPPELDVDNAVYTLNLARDMQDVIQSAKGSWWGTRESRAVCPEIIAELKKHADSHPNPAALVCFKRNDFERQCHGSLARDPTRNLYKSMGYIFSVITTENHYTVNFHASGYTLVLHVGSPDRREIECTLDVTRNTPKELLAYITETLHLTLVPSPTPTLRGLCSDATHQRGISVRNRVKHAAFTDRGDGSTRPSHWPQTPTTSRWRSRASVVAHCCSVQ